MSQATELDHEFDDGPIGVDWIDLASNSPGHSVMAEAAAAERAHPVKSFVARVLGMQADADAWTKGGHSAAPVGTQLDLLGPDWKCLHSVPLNAHGTEIDHLVIGPGGVFSLSVKNHRAKRVWVHTDTVKVDGRSQSYVPASAHEAKKATRVLTAAAGFPVDVTGVVVIVADALVIKGEPNRAKVVGRKKIGQWLQSQPPDLDASVIDAIYQVARRSTTWI